MLLVFSLTKDIFKDLLYNVQNRSKAKVVGQSDVPADASSWNESKLVFEAMEHIMDQTARVYISFHVGILVNL